MDINLQELDDPTFFAHWAAVRHRLALTPQSSPSYSEIKRRYDAVLSEYWRRLDSILCSDR